MSNPYDRSGTLLDRRYQIKGLLGKGGMGHVYDAVHVALDQRVAIKVLHPRFANEERFRERFIREARSASRIRHRNVVQITDFGETPDGSVYFVMEFLGGHDLRQEIRDHGAMKWSRARGILLQAVSALRAAHAKDIIHRDIKPANCFLTTEEEGEEATDVVKLLDFGIAKVGSDSHADAQNKGLTGTGEVFGTATYMSPEQARGDELDARSDLYSLGVMAYEILTGKVPFTGVNSIHVITRHLNDTPRPLRELDAGIPEAVEAIVLRALAKEADDRYASMAELERVLRAVPESGSARRTQVWKGRKPGAQRGGNSKARVEPMSPSQTLTGDRTAVVFRPSSKPGKDPGARRVGVAVTEPVKGEIVAPAVEADSPVTPRRRADARGGTIPVMGPNLAGLMLPAGAPEAGGGAPAAAPAWVPPASSTGPQVRRGESSAETRPQVLRELASKEVSEPVLSRRMISVAVFLVFVVGGVSALGTVAVLSSGTASGASAVEVGGREPHSGESREDEEQVDVESAMPRAVASSSEAESRPEAVTDVPVGSPAVSEGAREPADADDGAVIVIDDDEPSFEVEQSAPSAPVDAGNGGGSTKSAPVSRSAHESARCAQTREEARAAFATRDWATLIGRAKKKSCWEAKEQSSRLRMYVRALIEEKQFEKCVQAGRRSRDSVVVGYVKTCRKKSDS